MRALGARLTCTRRLGHLCRAMPRHSVQPTVIIVASITTVSRRTSAVAPQNLVIIRATPGRSGRVGVQHCCSPAMSALPSGWEAVVRDAPSGRYKSYRRSSDGKGARSIKEAMMLKRWHGRSRKIYPAAVQ